MSKTKKTISAEEFDRRFDSGQDISEHVDWDKTRRPGRELKRVNVDFPVWMVARLDAEAKRLGINRQAVIKTMLATQL
jgi:hypothetical protein